MELSLIPHGVEYGVRGRPQLHQKHAIPVECGTEVALCATYNGRGASEVTGVNHEVLSVPNVQGKNTKWKGRPVSVSSLFATIASSYIVQPIPGVWNRMKKRHS